MTSKEYLQTTLSHAEPDRIVIDFGATPVTGIHVLPVECLREYFGLKKKPVKVIDPYQMLGEIDTDLMAELGVDVFGIWPRMNMFGVPNEDYKPFRTFWGQEVLVPGNLKTRIDAGGDLLVYPEGDMTAAPSGRMPATGFFFDTIVRQEPFDEASLRVEENLEDFSLYSQDDMAYWKKMKQEIEATDKGVILNPGGTGFGDIALVPAPFMKNPGGIRDIPEWYLSTLIRTDFIHKIFEYQSEIAVRNLTTIKEIFENSLDVIYICGTDFGTQDSTFCPPETFTELYMPYYRKVNDWIHKHTEWKTFKHSCGAVEPFMRLFIEAGFDIVNPVQINAKGMNPQNLKDKYGADLTFWGGGVDTQKVLSFGSPGEVKKQVMEQCRILGTGGGFIFNTVHNIQANVPLENIVAMLEGIREYNGK